MANKNATKLSYCFKFLCSWFSVCLVIVILWLFSTSKTVYSEDFAWLLDAYVRKQPLEAGYSCIFTDTTLVTSFIDTIYMCFASVICDLSSLLYVKLSSMGFIFLPSTQFPTLIPCIIVCTININWVFSKYWPVTNLSNYSFLH